MKNKNLENYEQLLINVDMVNGFVKEGAMADITISRIIPENVRLVKDFLNKEQGVVFIKDTHNKDCREFRRYPIHCVKGTKEAELVDDLKPFEKDALVYEKNSTSTMYAPNFINDINKMKKLREIIVTGCCTDICVMNLVIPLQNYFDQIDKDVNIIVPKNAVDTYDAPNHKKDEYNEMAFKFMEQAGIQLVKKYERGNKYGK